MEDELTVVAIPPEALTEEALRGLVQEFVTRDGTDYGAVERSIEEKAAEVRRLLASGEARVVFDPGTETANIILAADLDSA
jgi:uncharacterized protein YheU (UPF0270 family)